MKKCPNCGAQMNDDSLFCTECGKPIPQGNVCSHCGSPINDDDAFCQSCGRKVDESPSTEMTDSTQKKCAHCGSPINDDDAFCQSCGRKVDESPSAEMTDSTQKKCAHCGSPINDDDAFCQSCGSPLNGVTISQTTAQVTLSCDEEEAPTDYKKIIIPIVIGLIVLILIGGGWYGYKEYSAYTKKKLAHEKFVADSLEQARKDSIKLVEFKEKERLDSIEKARILSLQEPYLNLLEKYGSKDEHWGEYYFLYDLTGDDFPELWLQVLENEEYKLLVFSNIEGVAKLLLRTDVGHPYHHSFYIGENYVLMGFAHMGSQEINKFYLENGVIKEENIFTLEAESLDEAVYKEITEPEAKTYEITDKSPIFEIK